MRQMEEKMKKPELLVPASSLEVLKIAVVFGADAVYIGGEAFGLRAKAKNFSMEEMKEGVEFAHAHGVKVYVMSSNEIGEQKKEPATIILGYANITECEIEQGVQKLLEAWKEYL